MLKERGYICFGEISRDFIQLGKEQGIDNYFKTDPHAFSNYLWKGRQKQFQQATALTTDYVFFDRAVHDVVGYLNYVKDPIPTWEKQLNDFAYDLVFLIKPVKEIYRQDEDRMESFEEALKVHKSLTDTYNKSGLKTISLPFTTPLARLDLILKHIKNG